VGKRSGRLGTTLVLALAIVVLAAGIGVGLSRYALPVVGWIFGSPSTTTTSPVVVEGIQDLDQLATVSWKESVIVSRESGGTELERFFSGEKVLLIATGNVEAGVNLAELGRDDVRVNGETVTIRLPEPEILSVSLDEDETRVYDRDFGLLNIHPDDELAEEARDAALDRIEEAARDEDILDQAEQNARDSIRAFVTSLGFEKVEFVD
jgi:Protein of unknown function (DUF4230)